jgi:hypothetical protein
VRAPHIKNAVVALVACVVCALLFASPADAKKKKRKRASPLNVVVLPFVGKGTGGSDVKEAIELELELVEVVQVSASDTLESDVRKGGKRAFDVSVLAGTLSKRGVDVLIKGERGPGEKNPDALLVVAYGKDGQPRFFKELALASEPDAAAATIVDSLRPTLEGWKSARPVRLPMEDQKDIDVDDVLVDDDLAGAPAKGGGRLVARSGGGDDEDDEKGDVLDDPPPPPPKRDTSTSKDGRKKSPLDFNDEPVERQKPSASSSSKKKRSRLDDDAEVTRVARTEIGEDGRRRTIDDVEDELDEEESKDGKKLAHTFALSAAFDGGTWRYQFDGAGIGDTTVSAPFYPGGSVLLDAWPLSWVGVDAEFGVGVVPFKINGGPIVVTPTEFTSIQLRGGGTAKVRYTLKNGIGLGGRAGYRFFGASVDNQTVNDGADNLTVVPGYQLHALSVGAEIFVPILIGGQRLEIDVRADGLPATFYAEQPDNPGRTSLAFGWHVQLATRYDLAGGVFFEARGQSTGTSVAYSEQGERKAFVGNTLQQLQGGSVLNLAAGFSVGLGYMF